MPTDSKIYDELNKGWKTTCRILLGDEVGELNEYEAWLKEYFPKVQKRTSHISGKEVALVMDEYCKDANFVSMDEVKEKAIEPLTINELKDIDSVAEAISEKWEYTGDRALGNSSSVGRSDLIMDSQYVYDCVNIQRGSYAYAAFHALDFKYAYGSGYFSQNCEFMLKHLRGSNDKRCFSTVYANDSSDLYFSMHCYSCHDLMFSLHQWNKRNCIGNLQLSQDKYQQIKAKLLEEMREELKRNKRLPTLFDMIPNEWPSSDVKITLAPEKKEDDFTVIEKAFLSTFKVLFKKDPGDMADYEGWLASRVVPTRELKSPFGSKVYLPKQHSGFWILSEFPDKRLVTYNESVELGKMHMRAEDVENLSRIKEWIAKTGCFPTEFHTGTYSNLIKTPVSLNAFNLYDCYTGVRSEYCGTTSWPIQSKYVFGSHWVTDAQYCLKCYNSLTLSRCFEVDTSTRCTDAWFCHNSEGLQDAMFCWNVKGKRCAIGNSQLPPEQYRKIKDALVSQMADEIVKNKELKWDVFNIGCAKK